MEFSLEIREREKQPVYSWVILNIGTNFAFLKKLVVSSV